MEEWLYKYEMLGLRIRFFYGELKNRLKVNSTRICLQIRRVQLFGLERMEESTSTNR